MLVFAGFFEHRASSSRGRHTTVYDADLIDRQLAHVDNKSTDKGTTVWREPAASYTSAERFAAELDVLRRLHEGLRLPPSRLDLRPHFGLTFVCGDAS